MKEITHIDEKGRPGMVDVSQKAITERVAAASGKIIMGEAIMKQLSAESFKNKKGPIIDTAIIAATMAVKNTYNVIPFCHQIPITSIKVVIDPNNVGFDISCSVKTNGQTGVEMEALQGVSAAALTIYDMCKALSHNMEITDIVLESKKGGKSDYER